MHASLAVQEFALKIVIRPVGTLQAAGLVMVHTFQYIIGFGLRQGPSFFQGPVIRIPLFKIIEKDFFPFTLGKTGTVQHGEEQGKRQEQSAKAPKYSIRNHEGWFFRIKPYKLRIYATGIKG